MILKMRAEGYHYSLIAHKLEISENAACVTFSRVRNKIIKQLNREEWK